MRKTKAGRKYRKLEEDLFEYGLMTGILSDGEIDKLKEEMYDLLEDMSEDERRAAKSRGESLASIVKTVEEARKR